MVQPGGSALDGDQLDLRLIEFMKEPFEAESSLPLVRESSPENVDGDEALQGYVRECSGDDVMPGCGFSRQ